MTMSDEYEKYDELKSDYFRIEIRIGINTMWTCA